MNSTQELSARIASLERTNRRIKIFGGLGLALCLVGFAAPKVCDVVTGERLVLHDERGRTRVSIDAYNTQTPSIIFTNSQGKRTGTLDVSDDGIASLTLFDAKGQKRGCYQWGNEPKTPDQPLPEKKVDTVSMAR
jgi:hypothetical protein